MHLTVPIYSENSLLPWPIKEGKVMVSSDNNKFDSLRTNVGIIPCSWLFRGNYDTVYPHGSGVATVSCISTKVVKGSQVIHTVEEGRTKTGVT
ncbi:hypothetical protein COOONC_04511 [Cooperia oncophora]